MDCLFDTSAAYAVNRPDDPDHDVARAFVQRSGLKLHTTSIIVGETYTLILRRSGYSFAIRWVRAAQRSDLVTIHHLSREDDALTWATIEQFAGVPLSYADASLVALGRRFGISIVFALDEDFRSAGLELVP